MARGFSGLTPVEAAVMDRWDADQGSRAISRELGLGHGRVSNIIAMYARDEQRSDNVAIASGSSALLAALRQARPELGA